MFHPSLPFRFIAAVTLFLLENSWADISVPAIFSDHMVLQQTSKVPVWGKADPGEKVAVTLDRQTVTTTTDAGGKWRVDLDLRDFASGPFRMSIQGKNTLNIEDVVVGQVWLAAGQSNMEWPLADTTEGKEEAAQSDNPLLRHFTVKKNAATKPQDQVEGVWQIASPKTSRNFTAVGYYFGKELQSTLKVPVGIINSSWGATPSEPWTSADALQSVPELMPTSERQWAFPEKLKIYVAELKTWLRSTGREDRQTADRSVFAAPDIPLDGWTPIRLPGIIQGSGIPTHGAIWIRREATFPEKPTRPFRITFGEADGIDSLYWNGRLIREYTVDTQPGDKVKRDYDIPAADIQIGRNVLALRIFAPVLPPQVKAAPFSPTDWFARAEFEFPPLPADAKPAPAMPMTAGLPQHVSSQLFNGMINPLIPYAIKGAIWYQGESNQSRGYQYRTAFPLLITDWRQQWRQGDFPFYFCQLANYQPKTTAVEEGGWPDVRESQRLALSLPNTAQAVLIDLGEADDVHPRNKREVGKRLALIALARDYGKNETFSGPAYRSMKVEEGKVRLIFDHIAGGLVARPLPEKYDVKTIKQQTKPLVRLSPTSELEGFAICGEDKEWVAAEARIDGDTVIIWSDKVPKPVAARYGWANNPTVNLYNKAGLPASPFRTDDFPLSTRDVKY